MVHLGVLWYMMKENSKTLRFLGFQIFYLFWTLLCLYEVFLPLEGLEPMGMSKIQFSTLFGPNHDYTNF
jgi:hypothetical protein